MLDPSQPGRPILGPWGRLACRCLDPVADITFGTVISPGLSSGAQRAEEEFCRPGQRGKRGGGITDGLAEVLAGWLEPGARVGARAETRGWS